MNGWPSNNMKTTRPQSIFTSVCSNGADGGDTIYLYPLRMCLCMFVQFIVQPDHRCRPELHAIPVLYATNFDSLNGYLGSSSFRSHICFFFFVGTCSTQICFAWSFMNFRLYRGSHSSLATPRSLQQRIRAFDLQPSVAVGIPSGEK